MELYDYKDFLQDKNLKEEDISKEQMFRYGQIAMVSRMAETLKISLTYNGLNWIDEVIKEKG